LPNFEKKFTYTELFTKTRFATRDLVMLQASIYTPNIRIGEQFDDARESTKLSGGAEPNDLYGHES